MASVRVHRRLQAWMMQRYKAVKALQSGCDRHVTQRSSRRILMVRARQQAGKVTQKAAWTGAVVGAVVGGLPPRLSRWFAGGITGGLIGHIYAGISRGDLGPRRDLDDHGAHRHR
jgi:hypothetical protein